MKNKPLKIEIKFEVFDDDPLKKEILKAFANLMKLLEASNDPKSTGTRWKNCSQECRDKFPIDSNENRSDNRPENLQHFPNKSAHNSHHKELDHATK